MSTRKDPRGKFHTASCPSILAYYEISFINQFHTRKLTTISWKRTEAYVGSLCNSEEGLGY
uniref:Uncharacterized protein n=1 Tax=Heterorhabditis bacteriophora TaxID=37862 RepID=A0A1I7WF90_HETBA